MNIEDYQKLRIIEKKYPMWFRKMLKYRQADMDFPLARPVMPQKARDYVVDVVCPDMTGNELNWFNFITDRPMVTHLQKYGITLPKKSDIHKVYSDPASIKRLLVYEFLYKVMISPTWDMNTLEDYEAPYAGLSYVTINRVDPQGRVVLTKGVYL